MTALETSLSYLRLWTSGASDDAWALLDRDVVCVSPAGVLNGRDAVVAFMAPFAAGLVIVWTGWTRADALASLLVAVLMSYTGWQLVRAAGRVFLEAAPHRIDPFELGETLAAVEGVAQVHDLHVWQLGHGEDAVSAHVLVSPANDCHEVSGRLRLLLAERYGIGHVTLQADHADTATHDAADCVDAHGEIHVAPSP